MTDSVRALAALAQERRLRAFRLLVKAGPDGMGAGALATALDIAPPALSFHMAQLFHAGLVTSRREGRHVIYCASFERMRDLLGFLTEDCCGGRPEICADLPVAAARGERKPQKAG